MKPRWHTKTIRYPTTTISTCMMAPKFHGLLQQPINWDEWWWLHEDTVPTDSLFMEGMPPLDELSRWQAEAMNVRMGDPRPMTDNDSMVDFDVDFNIMDETLSWLDNSHSSFTPSLSWTTQTDCSAPASRNPVTPPMPSLQKKSRNLPPSQCNATYTCVSCPKKFYKPHELK